MQLAHGAYDFNSKKLINAILHVCFILKNWTYGDGGCITTNNDKYSKNIRMIKNLGSFNKFDCEVQGVNSRLDTIQAAILNLKIKDLNKNNKKRTNISQIYKNNINNDKIEILNYKKGCVYHHNLNQRKEKIIKLFQKEKIQFNNIILYQ